MLEVLNPEQRRAVEHFEGPCLVLAGAGSGKTRVLTTRVCQLVMEHGVPPERILAVTFTNKAAQEMRERVVSMLGGDPKGIWMSTFHALGARLMRRHAPELGWTRAFTIRDADQSLREVKKAQKSVDIDPLQCSPRAVRDRISDAKNHLIGVEEFREQYAGRDLFLSRVAVAYGAYQEALKRQDAMDFDDLLVLPVRLFESNPKLLARYQRLFSFILVDEYQDTNRAQFRLLELLAAEHRNLMVVGDDDQSIYGWRGADIRNILDFEKSFPGAVVVRLEQNYRSTPVILDAANVVIRQNLDRKEKTMRTELVGGRADHPGRGRERGRRGPLDRRGDRAPDALEPRVRPPPLRGPLPHQCAVTGAGGPLPAPGPPLPDRGRGALLRASRDPGCPGLPSPDRQPSGHGRLRSRGELPAPRGREDVAGTACTVRAGFGHRSVRGGGEGGGSFRGLLRVPGGGWRNSRIWSASIVQGPVS